MKTIELTDEELELLKGLLMCLVDNSLPESEKEIDLINKIMKV